MKMVENSSTGYTEHRHGGLALVLNGDSLVGLFPENAIPEAMPGGPIVQVHVTGENRSMHHGVRSIGSTPGDRMHVVGVTEEAGKPFLHGQGKGTLVTVELADSTGDTGLVAKAFYHFVDDLPVVRSWVEVENRGNSGLGLEWVYSLALYNLASSGLQGWWEKVRLHVGHNSWFGEGQWRSYAPHELGLTRCNRCITEVSAAQVSSVGSWSTQKALPMGVLEDVEQGMAWFWQIEHAGTWSWEVAEGTGKQLYLLLGGPTEPNGGWWLSLKPGESFCTVPVAAGAVAGGFEAATDALTRYRRECLVPHHPLDSGAPVIFNDYMNCLMADPTTEKELPLIEAAAKAGAEYFVVDAGWYAPAGATWWDSVGAWEPDADRFPGGIELLMKAITDKGMVPGLWLEIEVAGMNGPLATRPDSWFMMRHGKRVADNGRYFLDFRNPEVRDYCMAVVDRLVSRYGVGYIKNDYNVNATLGTDVGTDSGAHGLLEHTRALYSWLEEVAGRFPNLVLESCASGGNRMDYGMLSRSQIQSSSDQMDYRLYPSILAGGAAGVVPEQLAVWSYPMKGGDCEETAFNMVNALLLRIHQSGHIAELEADRFALVVEGIAAYKSIRGDLVNGLPFWPMGFIPAAEQNAWYSFGIRADGQNRAYVAVWRLASGDDVCAVPLERFRGTGAKVEVLYPSSLPTGHSWNDASGQLTVKLDRTFSARVFSISW